VRSGGAFDPWGARSADIERADDVVAIVEAHRGRWLMITLTVDRVQFIGPEAAYWACQERVREVAGAVSLQGIWMAALELQGKTGDGWPHWHLIVWAPDDRSLASIEERVRRFWKSKHVTTDTETGEELVEWLAIAGPKGIKVGEARTIEGIARYAAKYVVKAWPAVPDWMGESRCQLRKLRLARGCFLWLAANGRHVIHAGGRKKAERRRRPARKLYDRMAASCSHHAVFKRVGESLRWSGSLSIPGSARGIELITGSGARVVRAGSMPGMRYVVDHAELVELRRAAMSEGRELVRKFKRERRGWLELEWQLMQERRELEERTRPATMDQVVW